MSSHRGIATSTVTIIITVFATVFVAARIFTRAYLVRSIKPDDWWILAAWVVSVGFSIAVCIAVSYGLGRHRGDIDDYNYARLHKAQYAFAILYNPSLMLTKTSIIVFFLSVMSRDVDKVFKWCNWLTLLVVNVGGAAFTFLAIFQCMPISAGYEYPVPESASCTDIVTLYLSSAPVNIITDIAIILLPMPILTGMRLPKKQKIILIITFSLGGFVAIVDVVRLAYLQNASTDRLHDAQTNSGSGSAATVTDDFSWDASLSFMWSAVEIHLGIMCACVPALKPLFLRFLPSFVKDTGDPDSQLGTRASADAGQAPTASVTNNALKRGDFSVLNNPAAFRRPTVREYAGSDDGDNMGFINMLAGPDDDAPDSQRRNTMQRTTTRASTSASVSDFGFVKMAGTKNMLKLNNRQSVWPIAVVTVIFFLWGFAYGLLDQLNAQFQRVVQVTTAQGLGLHASYFSGYLVGPLTLGRFILKRYGFKAAMMTGLCVYGSGALVFWPSGVLTSYAAFIVSNFIVAFGLSCLEIAANPYIALCGPLEYAEVRLNLSQAFQAVGTVFSPLLARKVLFDENRGAASLVDTQWAYLGIALFVFALAIVFYYIPLPEASDEELAELADRREAVYRTKVGPWNVVYVTLALGVFSQWCYVGLQECIGNNTQRLYANIQPNSSLQPADFQTVGHTVFAVGRFLAAFLNYVLKPRWILLVLWLGLIVTNALQMVTTGTGAAVVQMLTYAFEAGIFAIIFAICMRGLGAHTKTGSAFMTAAISGGAVFPVIQYSTWNVRGIRYSYCVPMAIGIFGLLFPIYLNLVPAARKQVDPIHEKRAAARRDRANRRNVVRTNSAVSSVTVSNQFGLAGIIARHHKKQRNAPSVQHFEQKPPGTSSEENNMFADDLYSPSSTDEKQQKDMFVQMNSPQGVVGELTPWPGLNDRGLDDDDDDEGPKGESSTAGSSSKYDPTEDITRHRPIYNDGDGDDDDEDDILDYHAVMRKM